MHECMDSYGMCDRGTPEKVSSSFKFGVYRVPACGAYEGNNFFSSQGLFSVFRIESDPHVAKFQERSVWQSWGRDLSTTSL